QREPLPNGSGSVHLSKGAGAGSASDEPSSSGSSSSASSASSPGGSSDELEGGAVRPYGARGLELGSIGGGVSLAEPPQPTTAQANTPEATIDARRPKTSSNIVIICG